MAIDMNLVSDIRAGRVTRQTLLTISNEQATIRAWSGRGELTFDGVTYGGTSDGALIAVSSISDTAQLQSHEVTISIDAGAARELGINGFSARGASVEVVAILLAGDGSIRDFRKVLFGGTIQSSSVAVSHNEIAATYTCRPPLLNMSRDRMTRYTSPDQARRFGSTDTGFDDVPGLTNKEPVEWSPSNVGAAGDIFVQWSLSGGVITLTDTAARPVILAGASGGLAPVECGATDRLGQSGGAVAGSYGVWKKHANDPNPTWRYYSITSHIFNQVGYGATVSPVNAGVVNDFQKHSLDGVAAGVADFIGCELNVDGFVYADGAKVVVDQGNNRVYSHNGNLLLMMQMRMQDDAVGGLGEAPPAPAPICTDIAGDDGSNNWHFASFDSNQYLEAQAI